MQDSASSTVFCEVAAPTAASHSLTVRVAVDMWCRGETEGEAGGTGAPRRRWETEERNFSEREAVGVEWMERGSERGREREREVERRWGERRERREVGDVEVVDVIVVE